MADIKIYASNIDGKTVSDCYRLAKKPPLQHAKIRIMPDAHPGKGCVIGFTAAEWTYINPSIVGVDIGCGMLAVQLKEKDIDFAKLDDIIQTYVPSGHGLHERVPGRVYNAVDTLCDRLYAPVEGDNRQGVIHSMGTLGGGNHFIEVDKAADGTLYLIIHTGSRHLGATVAAHYIRRAIRELHHDAVQQRNDAIVQRLKAEGRPQDIQKTLMSQGNVPYIPEDDAYLFGKAASDYLHDMEIVQGFAHDNRCAIANIILEHMDLHAETTFESVHNYIDFYDHIIRKGAIAAYRNQKVIIPINMQESCIIGTGKSNSDWNCSAPHGAGRILSRTDAKASLSMDEFQNAMQGIYSTSICQSTLDESPMAYKKLDDILPFLQETVDVEDIIKPVYNFKAH